MTNRGDVLPLHVEGTNLAPVDVKDAAARVWAYCTHPRSGWSIYDLAAVSARGEGHFERVRQWDLLLAALMNARPSVAAVAAFTVEQREDFAARVAAVPESKPLCEFTDAELEVLVHLSAFGFAGARTATMTKLAALYRPHAATILDSYLAGVFGFAPDGFTFGATEAGEVRRRQNIRHALAGLRSTLGARPDWMGALREAVRSIPGMAETSDVRLLDIVLWTTQDDARQTRESETRGAKERTLWVEHKPGPIIPAGSTRPVTIPGA